MAEPTSASVLSVALSGMDGHLLDIRAVLRGPDDAAADAWYSDPEREVRDRISAAVRNSGYRWPPELVALTVPLARGWVSSAHDLAAALAVLVASSQLPADVVRGAVAFGELGLDGSLRPVRGVLPALLAARTAGIGRAIVPRACQPEAQLVPLLHVIAADTLADLAALLTTPHETVAVAGDRTAGDDTAGPPSARPIDSAPGGDLADVRCPPAARRALLIAAAGGHPIQLTGPGSVMLARRLPGLLPPLTGGQALEVAAIRSLAGIPPDQWFTGVPYVAPHHSTSRAAFIGGGPSGRPGALARACHGVLHLDDAEDFGPHHLEDVRIALDEGEIRLTHAAGTARYPTRFQLVLTRHDPTPRYRLPGLLLDRIPIRVHLPTTPSTETPGPLDTTTVARDRVSAARERAAARWANLGGTPATNATVHPEYLHQAKPLPHAARTRVDRLLQIGALTKRGAVQVARLAWTVADLAGLEQPGPDQIAEALAFRGHHRPA